MWTGAQWQAQQWHFQNMRPDEVDWAQLAKQWIQMKETDVPSQNPISNSSLNTQSQTISSQSSNIGLNLGVPPPPPPPIESKPQNQNTSSKPDHNSTCGGEMDMDIEDDRDLPTNNSFINGTEERKSTNWQPGWPSSAQQGAIWPTGQGGTSGEWSVGESSGWQGASGGGPWQTGQSWGWGWNAGDSCGTDLGPYGWDSHGDNSTEFTDNNKRQIPKRSKGGFQHGNGGSLVPSMEEIKEADFQLDAAQRRKLPAWIREGLEKMEREKQRKLDRERELSEKEEMLRRKREQEAKARKLLEEDISNDGKPRIPQKSKFESDSDESDVEEDKMANPVAVGLGYTKKASRFNKSNLTENEDVQDTKEDDKEGINSSSQKTLIKELSPEPVISEEERVRERMLKLKKWMTEILLDVTSSMMFEVCTEAVTKAKMKAPAVQVKGSSALASLSSSLGLSIYSDSEDSEGEQSLEQGNLTDSDEELRQTIQRKKQQFEQTEREILRRIQAEHDNENKNKTEASQSKVNSASEDTQDSSMNPDDHNQDGYKDTESDEKDNFEETQTTNDEEAHHSVDSDVDSTGSNSSSDYHEENRKKIKKIHHKHTKKYKRYSDYSDSRSRSPSSKKNKRNKKKKITNKSDTNSESTSEDTYKDSNRDFHGTEKSTNTSPSEEKEAVKSPEYQSSRRSKSIDSYSSKSDKYKSSRGHKRYKRKRSHSRHRRRSRTRSRSRDRRRRDRSSDRYSSKRYHSRSRSSKHRRAPSSSSESSRSYISRDRKRSRSRSHNSRRHHKSKRSRYSHSSSRSPKSNKRQRSRSRSWSRNSTAKRSRKRRSPS